MIWPHHPDHDHLSLSRIIFCLLICFTISGCGQSGYYFQAVRGQLSLLNKRVPVDDLLADKSTPEELSQRLILASQIRQYALAQLGLTGNRGFSSYADLGRPYVTWNVVAAPPYSLDPETWCFPIAGCVSYKGYFDKQDAEAFEQTLLAQGKDTLLYGVSAYSTLGWFADPLLNTFINYADHDLAALIFHELAHQLVYVKDDSDFNEAFATAVESILLDQWLLNQGNTPLIASLRQQQQRQDRITTLILEYRDKLAVAYKGADAERQKPVLFADLKAQYQQLKQSGEGTRYYDWWFSRDLDNADLLTVSTYYQLVPGFLDLYRKQDSKLSAFIAEVKKLSRKEREARRKILSTAD